MCLEQLSASFRDPSGFVFRYDGELYRQINDSYAAHYELLMASGLYDALVKKGWLVAHKEIDPDAIPTANAMRFKIIKPELIPYVSYPYEWCFSQLKDAALLTLSIQAIALQHDMMLKDASAYNIQFQGYKPVFIDTLSFERYREGEPWIAYRQFCQHFLGPLAAMAFCDVRLRHLLKGMIDGLPLDLVSRLLPRRTLAKYSFLAHIHLHATSQKRHQDDARERGAVNKAVTMSKTMQLALVASLQKAVNKCRLRNMKTEWGDYYEDTNYSEGSMSAKERLIKALVASYVDVNETVHDIGGNTGRFSRLVAASGHYVLSHDVDEMAVERNYLFNKENRIDNVLPLVLDLRNPSPALGWALAERDSLTQRINSDVIMALALIHHIVISNNVPMTEVAGFFRQLSNKLIIEFVPKEDSQVRRLLVTRDDIFPHYDIEHFEQEFTQHFIVRDKQLIEGTKRTLFVFERK